MFSYDSPTDDRPTNKSGLIPATPLSKSGGEVGEVKADAEPTSSQKGSVQKANE